MHRARALIGVLGLVLAAVAARADVPKEATLFGQKYSITVTKRYGTFKNGQTVKLQSGNGGAIDDATIAKKANLCFVPGADASADRLYVAAGHQDDPDATADGLYLLTGADANGVFGPDSSNATVYFRGNRDVHGRPQTITWINDTNTGVKADRNLYMTTFTGTDFMRWYDEDSLQGTANNAFRDLTVFRIVKPAYADPSAYPNVAPDTDQDADPNAPANGYFPAAIAPNGMMIVASQNATNDGIELGVIDPVKGTKFLPVKTNLPDVTSSSAVKIDPATAIPHSLVRVGTDEYWMLATDPDGGVNSDETAGDDQNLYHVKITLPADLTKDAPNSIKVDVLGKEDMLALHLGGSPTGKIYGVAVGRELSPGKPIIYMADWAGNLLTLRPNVTPTAGQ